MDQLCTSCVCHSIPRLLTQRECGCVCHRHEQTLADDEWRNPKRRRLDEPIVPLPVAVNFGASHDAATSTEYLRMGSYTKVDANSLHQHSCIRPSSDRSTSQTYLTVNDTCTVQQGPSRSRGRAPASTTYFETSHTLSPRSQETPSSADQRASTSPSHEVGAENPLAGLSNPDFGFNLNGESSWNESHCKLSPFGSTDLWAAPLTCAAPDIGNTFLNSYGTETQQNGDFILLAQASQNRWTRRSNDPWAYLPSFADGKGGILRSNTNQNIDPPPGGPTALVQSSNGLQPIRPSTNEVEDSSGFRWDNTFGEPGSPNQLKQGKRLAGRPGCRRGPLQPDNKQRILAVRRSGACYRCRLEKLPCSPTGIPCNRCKKSSISPSSGRICFRRRLRNYTRDLFPDIASKRFQKDSIDLLIKDNILGFTKNEMTLEISSGPDYPIISLTVHEFRLKNREFLTLKYVGKNNTGGGCCDFTDSFALPLGLDGDDFIDLKRKCTDHVKSVIDQERDIGEATKGDISMLSWEVFEAVNRYRKSTHQRHSLLRNAVILRAGYYFMSRIITLTKASATMAVSRLRGPTMLNYLPILTSQLINLQVKQVMHDWLFDMTSKVLEAFDAALIPGPRRKDNWVDHFCIVLILCICIEAVQVASDSQVMADLRKDPLSPLSRASTCRQLDDGAYTHLTDLFHTFYRTQKKFKPHSDKGGINPIQDGLVANESDGITPQMENLVLEIKEIMKRRDKDIAQRARNPSFESVTHLLTHHMAFRKINSGRLLAKFLSSFSRSV